ncbi:hypothetical protein [Acinetobacter nosocomialis]|uniref:hypothetical protein n=1 Tax=Acinetobacter nosocomialis TaxID=106654 RepID=UPI001966279A|nr:hypothetical protein [Acinetobacter nosocomialis]MBM9550034.1 hypothetical protein [Acinetobacter nosocomialis]
MDNYKEYLDPADGYALVKQSVNMLVRPHWIDIPEGADCLMQWPTGHKVFYRNNFAESWNSAYREWHFVSGDDGVDQSITLWKRQPQDPALISGADALRALADGKDVQVSTEFTSSSWNDDTATYTAEEILAEETAETDDYNSMKLFFRLKPQTIKLELEIPAPYKAKIGGRDDTSFVLNVGRHQYLYQNEDDYTKARDALEAVFDAAVRGTNS